MTSAAPKGGFDAFALKPDILTVLKELGYEEPTPIQKACIPPMLEGKDVLGQAATGTGKTAAFALPIVQRLEPHGNRPFETQALVLVPTRELAMQVAEAVDRYGLKLGVRVLPMYGGQEFHHQVAPLKKGVDVVVATPGRALDHIRRKTLKLAHARFVVLDEADEMLDMGFAEDLESILKETPEKVQTALFSATLPARIVKIAEQHLEDPVRVTIAPKSAEAGTLPNIRQAAYIVPKGMKQAALLRVLEVERPERALVFCRTRLDVDDLTVALNGLGQGAAALHGGMNQEQRDAVLGRFKGGELRLLVATDVAARGLHVDGLSHVVNFDLPVSPEPYVHRIGRTGRAGTAGVALSFLEPRERRLLENIERTTKKKIPIEAVPSPDKLVLLRQQSVATVVKDLLGRKNEAFEVLAKSLTSDEVPMERVAAAALLALQQRLFPPQASDDEEFPSADTRGGGKSQGRFDQARGPSKGGRFERGPSRGPSSERPRFDRGAAPGRSDRYQAGDVRGAGRPSRFDRGGGAPDSEPTAPNTRVRRYDDAKAQGGHKKFGEPPHARFRRTDDASEHGPTPSSPRAGGATTWLFLTLGERAGVRPQDVVGAIANEAAVSSRVIGDIRIGPEGSRVEVPAAMASKIIDALSKTTLRGRRFKIDFDRSRGVGRPPGKKPHAGQRGE